MDIEHDTMKNLFRIIAEIINAMKNLIRIITETIKKWFSKIPFIPPRTQAGTAYYVDATLGDDAATGLEGYPWRTISKVNSKMGDFTSDDRILFKRGEEWRETPLLITCSGTSGHEITFGNYGTGDLPLINGATVETTWTLHPQSPVGSLNIYQKTFSNEPFIVVEDDTFLTYLRWDTSIATTFTGARSGLGTWARNGNTAYVCCTDNTDPDTHTMEVGAQSGASRFCIRVLNSDHIVIDGLATKYATLNGINIRITNTTITNVKVTNCNVYSSGSSGIIAEDTVGDGVEYVTTEFSYNTCHYNGAHGIHHYSYAKDCHTHHNTLHHNGWYHEGTGGHGVSSWGSSATAQPTGLIVEHNTAYNQYRSHWGGEWKEGTGIHADGYTTDSIYRYNLSYENEGAGFYENGQPANNKWHYNIAYGNGTYQPDNGTAGFVCGRADGNEFYNNVSYDNTNCGWASYGTWNTVPKLKNNLFFENVTHEIRMAGTGYDPPDSDYNCFHYSGGGDRYRINYVNYTFSEWQTVTSKDGNSQNSDPSVVDAAGGDFHLSDTDSPCYEAGTDVSITEDYDGTTVPTGTNPEIGAFEYFEAAQEVSYLKITGTASKNAGETNELTITAYDSEDAVVTAYEGEKNLIFSGPNLAPDSTSPTVEGVNIGSETTVTFANGVSAANAATLVCYKAESVSLDVSDGEYDSTGDAGYDLDLTIAHAAVNNLFFLQQPTDTEAGQTITPAVTVNTRDDWHNICTTDDSTSVGISIYINPSGGTLTGTSPRTASSGVVTFNDLSIDIQGVGYKLQVGNGIAPQASNAFNISPYASGGSFGMEMGMGLSVYD